ncbi:hypothetical protein N0V90_004700 [Kalmusia sp. IMI 367209]|nr:hypothetical protein N0V90_004700 [Kalmusia sp. IMI 367209]
MLEKAEKTPTKTDSELETWKGFPLGYPRMSERIAEMPETGIYRRFDALNARNLLYLQSELCILEKTLHELEVMDNHDKRGNRSKYATDFQWMLDDPPCNGKEQLMLVEKIRKKLSQYNKALIQHSTLQKVNAPDRYDLSNVQFFLYSDDMGANEMTGEDSLTWGSPDDPDRHANDLIGLKPRHRDDTFSRLVAENAVHLFKCGLGRFKRRDNNAGRLVYYDSNVMKITFWITSIIASLLPIASIFVLISLKSLNAKLGTIAAFNVLMSVCLTVFTDAKRTDVFAVTAA